MSFKSSSHESDIAGENVKISGSFLSVDLNRAERDENSGPPNHQVDRAFQASAHAKRNKMKKKTHSSKGQGSSKANFYDVAAAAFWRIAEHYSLTQKQQAGLLGIKFNKDRLGKMRNEIRLPDDQDKLLRVSYLVAIHKNLRVLFPHNREVVYSWMQHKRECFGDVSAIDYIISEPLISLQRLAEVRRFLDRTRIES